MVAALSVRLTLSHTHTHSNKFFSFAKIDPIHTYIHTYIHVISGIKVINAQKLGAKAVMIGEQCKYPLYIHTCTHI